MKRAYLLLLLPVILFFSCTKGGLDCSASGDSDNVEFTYKVKRFIFPCADTLQATVTLIEDARCPANATCISGGNIKVTLVIGDVTVKLTKGYSTDVPSQDVAYNGRKFRVTLLNVAPYPMYPDTVPDSDKKANISIVQL